MLDQIDAFFSLLERFKKYSSAKTEPDTVASRFVRLPVIITPEHYPQWLDKAADAVQAFTLLDSQAYSQMMTTPICDWVNNPRHDDERCIQAK